MTKGTAEDYWAATAEGHFESMCSPYQAGESGSNEPVSKPTRRVLPPLTASQSILDAIAACAQPRESAVPASETSSMPQEATLIAE